MTDPAPTPREAADRVALWLDQWRPDRHQTYSLARADLQVLIDQARATTPGDDRGRELAEIANDIGNLRDGPLDEMRERARALAASIQKRAHDATARALAAPAETEAEAGDEAVERAAPGTHVPGYGPYYKCPPCREQHPYTIAVGGPPADRLGSWQRCPVCGDEWRRLAATPPAPAGPQAEGAGETAGGEPVALTPCRCGHVFARHLPNGAGCIAKGCACPDYVVPSGTGDNASASGGVG